MRKIQLSQRAYTINDVKRLMEHKELTPQPKYQRRRTSWPLNAKTGLIDTILCNYPIPPIYIRSFMDENHRRRTEIIDGQQRISTIIEFLNGIFKLTNNLTNNDYVGRSFQELPLEIQDNITDYELSFTAIVGATDSDIISIFSRMNSFSLPLNSQEKRNALYAGQFKTTVYEIASQYYTFFHSFKILGDSNIARMKDAELVSELFSAILIGLNGMTSKKIDDNYKNYDTNFDCRNDIQGMFNQIMSYLGSLLENDIIRGQFSKVIWFLPLFLVLYQKCYGDLGSKIMTLQHKPDLTRIQDKLTSLVDVYLRGTLPVDAKLLFQQGSKSPSKVQQRIDFLIKGIYE
jgi:hypothetical protein